MRESEEQEEIRFESFGRTVQYLAASCKVRPEAMLAYVTSALGNIFGPSAAMKDVAGRSAPPSLSLSLVARHPSRAELMALSVMPPILDLQQRKSNSVAGKFWEFFDYRKPHEVPCELEPAKPIGGIRLGRGEDPRSATQHEVDYVKEGLRYRKTLVMTSPSPRAFERLRAELDQGVGLVFDPSGRLLEKAASSSPGNSADWQNLLDKILSARGFGFDEDDLEDSTLFSTHPPIRLSLLSHLSPELLEINWQSNSTRKLVASSIIVPTAPIQPYPFETVRLARVAHSRIAKVVEDFGRSGQQAPVFTCENVSGEFQEAVDRFEERIESLPTRLRIRCSGLVGLPLKLYWASQILDGEDLDPHSSVSRGAIESARWCLDQHLAILRQYDSLLEERELIRQARPILEKLLVKAPCTYRDIYRGRNSQRRSEIEPVIDFLSREGIVSVSKNLIELNACDTLPEWFDAGGGCDGGMN